MLAVSWTCLRDKDMCLRLHEELEGFGINHLMFVEDSEVSSFGNGCISRGTNDNATNGFGGAGTRGKHSMYKLALPYLYKGESLIDIDSDVSVRSHELLKAMDVLGNSMAGFYELKEPIHKIDGKPFIYFTGCFKSYSYDLFYKICNSNIDSEIDRMVSNGMTPSEDAFFSYYSQIVLGATAINMQFRYKHGKQTKQYDNPEWDIVS